MRIAHVIDYFHEDVGYQEYYLARFQAEEGHAVRVIASTFRHSSLQKVTSSWLGLAGVDVVRLPGHQLGHDRAWLRGLTVALREFAPDAVHMHGAFAPTTVRTASWCRRYGVGLLVDTHLREELTPSAAGRAGRAFYRAYRAGFGGLLHRSVGRWMAVGPDEARFLAARLPVAIDEIQLAPLGFDPGTFRFNATRRTRFRADEGWDDDLIVVMTGKLYAEKRPDLVAAACERRVDLYQTGVRLVLAGNLSDEVLNRVRAAAPGLAASGRIVTLPMLDRATLADLFVAADVAAFPVLPSISVQEAAGTGVTVVMGRGPYSEWLQARCPTIRAVDLGSLAEELVPAEDREIAASRARQALSWSVISGDLVHAYETCVSMGADLR